MTNRCVRCLNNFETHYKGNVCNDCSTIAPGFPSLKSIGVSRILLKGTEWETTMTKAHEEEIGRAVAIPIGNGKFAQGRRMENGKIAEKYTKNWERS